MITASEAENLANKTVSEYVRKCECETHEDVANVVMQLASKCGLVMCSSVGQEEAVSRMQGTTNYIARERRSAARRPKS